MGLKYLVMGPKDIITCPSLIQFLQICARAYSAQTSMQCKHKMKCFRAYQDASQGYHDMLDSQWIMLQKENNSHTSDFNSLHICGNTVNFAKLSTLSNEDMLSPDKPLNFKHKFVHEKDLDPDTNISHDKLHNLLLKCRKERDLAYALQLHHYVHEHGLDVEDSWAEELILTLTEVGCMTHARKLFDRLEYQGESSWNALIVGYAKFGEPQHALDLYQKMQYNASLVLSGRISMALLQACAKLKNFDMGECIHTRLDKRSVEEDVYVGSSLIHMYMKCGYLTKAQEVFDKLQVQNVVTWNALVSGSVENRHFEEALGYYKQMHHNGISPDAVTFVCILKACGHKGDAVQARKIHAEILKAGVLEGDVFVGSSLVDAYVKCALLAEAQLIFEKLPDRNIVSWNAMIAGLTELGFHEKALLFFEQVCHNDISPDAVTLICGLKACAGIAAAVKAQEIHAHIVKIGVLDSDVFFGSILVDVYAKCGWLSETKYMFESFSVRDVVLWNAFISGLSELGQDEEALKCFDQMQNEGLCPNSSTFISSLKACSNMGAPFKGHNIHIEILKQGRLEQDAFVGSILVDAYAKCGLCAEAESVFQMLPGRDHASWNALLAGYAEYRSGEGVLKHFKVMQLEGIAPDAITFLCTLKACSDITAISEGREMHMEIVKRGFWEDDIENILINMYSKCCSLGDAQHVFDHLPSVSVVSSNTLISGYIECGREEKVLDFYTHQHLEHAPVDATTLACSLKACSTLKATAEAKGIHHEAVYKGLEHDLLVSNTLVDVYARCGLFTEAHDIVHKLENPDIIAWTALLTGYVEHGFGDEALYRFECMLDKGISWDAVTLVCILTACGSTRAIEKGRAFHVEALKRGLFDTQLSVGNALVDMYARCGALGDAQKVFISLPSRDMAAWNVFISGYVELGCSEDAIGFLEQIWHEGISSDVSILICGLKACSSMAAMDIGRELHAEIVQKGLETQLLVGNTLIDMYVKCGAVPAAQYAFDKLQAWDLVSWNTIIAGYGQHGQSTDAFDNLDKMRTEDMEPDLVTFSSILSACSHAGVVDLGQVYFEATVRDHGLIPTVEHYTCLIDILGRAGQVDKAMAVTNKMPCHPGIVAWHSVLGACTRWGNVEIGREAFEQVVALDDKDAAAYVCMCNIYVNAIMHEQGM